MATRGSAVADIRGAVALEDAQDGFQLGAQFLHGFGGERPARFGFQLSRTAILLDFLARAFDRVLLRVQEVLHQHDQLDFPPLVDTVSGPVLGRIQEPELAFPVPQDVRLQIGELAHLADREELLHRLRRWTRAHRHCSALRSRSIRSVTACRGALPRKSTSATSRAMGSSTPCRSPSATAVRAVFTPSATVCFPACACSNVCPCPSATPRLRLRDSAPVAVRIRSPMPASPANVMASAPSATPSRVISARPRVITAARVL